MNDNRTISDIVSDPDLEAKAGPVDEELAAVKSTVTDGTFKFAAMDVANALKFATPIAQAKEEAQIPPQLSIKDLVGTTFVIADKVQQKAYLPEDGSQHDGWQCLCADVETQKPFTVWIGQVRLKRDLELLVLPLRVTLNKRGRAYIFS